MIQLSAYPYIDNAQLVTFMRTYDDGKRCLSCEIVIQHTQFIEYQRELFEEHLAEISDVMQDTTQEYSNIKRVFEEQLQELNTKLATLTHKLTPQEPFLIQGMIHVFVDDSYISTFVQRVF